MAYDIDRLPNLIILENEGDTSVALIAFDVSAWDALYPAGVYSIRYTRCGETDVYPEASGNVSHAEGVLTWTPGAAVLDVPGRGSVVIRCTEADVLKHSRMTYYYVVPGMTASLVAPDPLLDYIEKWGAADITLTEKLPGEALTQGVTQDATGTHFALQVHAGNGIASIVRTTGDGLPGTTDTYTITFDDETIATFDVTHGYATAEDLPLTDSGSYFPTKNVEAALQLVGSPLKTQLPVGTALGTSLTDGRNLLLLGDTFTLAADITDISDNIVIDGQNRAVIDGDGQYRIDVSGASNIKFRGIRFTNMYLVKFATSSGITFENCTFDNMVNYGIYLQAAEDVVIKGCIFDEIGAEITTPETVGYGIHITGGDGLIIKDCHASGSYGNSMIYINSVGNISVSDNVIHDTAYRAIQIGGDPCTGSINNNTIYNCGSINTTESGVGCNGIFGSGPHHGLHIRENHISNVMENGIEGHFGFVDNNLIDGTGVDVANHPTPSVSGIWGKSLLIRNNRIFNTGGKGINYSAEDVIDGMRISGNLIDSAGSSPAISINSGTGYANIHIWDNKSIGVESCVGFSSKSNTINTTIHNNSQIGGLRTYDTISMPAKLLGAYKNAFVDGVFNDWTSTSELTSWAKGNVTLSQLAEDQHLLPVITSAGSGYAARIIQIVPLESYDFLVHVKVLYKGDDYLKLKFIPVKADGTLLTASTWQYVDTDFSPTAYREVNYTFRHAGFNKIKIEIGNSATDAAKYVQLLSAECSIIQN